MPSSPSTLQPPNRRAPLSSRIDSQLFISGHIQQTIYSHHRDISTVVSITSYLMRLLLIYSFFFSGDGSSEVKSESPFPTDELGDMGTVSIVSS